MMNRPDVILSLKQQAVPILGHSPDIRFAHAHGCLDVLGALEAEGGGTLAQMVLPAKIAVALQPRDDSLLRFHSAQIAPPLGDTQVQLDLRDLIQKSPEEATQHFAAVAPSRSGWTTGLLALFYLLYREARRRDPRGANLLIHSDLPMGAGQSSSTALLVATARAAASHFGLESDPARIAHWAASAEALASSPAKGAALAEPSRAHIIDALTCQQEPAPRPSRTPLLRYSAQPHRFVGPVPIPSEVRVFALDTGVRYHSTRTTLDELRIAAAMGTRIIDTIYTDLGQPHTPLHGYLTNTSPLLYHRYFRPLLPKRLRGSDFVRTYGPLPAGTGADALDPNAFFRVRTAVDHIIAENEHAEQFLQAMEELAERPPTHSQSPKARAETELILQRAGRLLLASHHSYRLRLELSCREADWLVDCLMESGPEKGVYGARITGCGGGGTVIALLHRSEPATDALLSTIKSYHHLTGLNLGVVEV